ncbi:MAG: right-handed parallel beta-helix repeat-containing protein [Acidobacteriota bacterium]|nr:right-handed parallel beta-helix repeat-containing protein [Acidobacteriota bacterium]
MKNKLNLSLRVLAIFALAITFSVAVNAQATRTWVSGVGDDVNPCSRTAPCKTFAGAISKTAANGEINALDPGGYGTITITKSITVDGSNPGIASILAAGTTGIVVNAQSTDTVILRNLSIHGAGTGVNGIRILNAKAVYIENCVIFNFTGSSATTGRGITDERAHAGGFLYVNNTTVMKNVQSNLFVGPTGGAVTVQVDNSRFLGSTANSGIAIRGGSKASIKDSEISGNLNFGIVVEADVAGTFAAIDSCTISNNGTGVSTTTGSPTAQIAQNLISGNGTGVLVSSGTMRSSGNRIDGNTTNVTGILSGYNVQ